MIKAIFSYILSVVEFLCALNAGSLNTTQPDNGVIDVYFDAVNGSPVYSYTAEQNALLTEPEQPEKRGLVFKGWYCEDKKWDFQNDTVSEDTTLKAKWDFSENFFENDMNAGVRADGSNVRVMSFNILASDWSNKPAVKGRDTLFLDVIARYLPDVIGMQEVNAEWYASLGEKFGTYRIVNQEKNKILGEVNYSTIAYNTEKVNLIKYSQKHYAVRNSDNCRNITWALFELKQTGERFIVTSTHWELTPKLRLYEAFELAGFVRLLKERYGVPVFSTGDYNATELTDECTAFVRCSGFENTKYSAKKRGLTAFTYHLGDGTGSADDYQSGYWKLGTSSFRQNKINTVHTIDHIFASENTEILYFDTVADKTALEASDHCPIYIDALV